jgi:hypothetical protein
MMFVSLQSQAASGLRPAGGEQVLGAQVTAVAASGATKPAVDRRNEPGPFPWLYGGFEMALGGFARRFCGCVVFTHSPRVH